MAFVERYVTSTAGGGGDGTLGDPWTLPEAASAAVAGDRVNIKAGTYVLAASFSPSNDGTNSSPIVWSGYSSTIGDADAPVVTLDVNGASAHAIDCVRAYHRFEYLTATGNAGISGVIYGISLSGIANIAFRCRATSVRRGILAAGQGVQIVGCEVDQWAGNSGIQLAASNSAAIGCHMHDGGGFGGGFSDPSSGGYYYCVSANNDGNGFLAGQSGGEQNRWLVHCTAYGNGGDGVTINGTPDGQPFVIANCLLVENFLYGIGGSNTGVGTPHVTLLGCGFFGNGNGEIRSGVGLSEAIPRVSLAADPIVDMGAGDSRLRADAEEALGTGFPGNLLIDGSLGSWRGAPDLGAIQQTVRPLVNPGFVGAF
ncbi:MAG: hypothetical protein DHS20C16_24090 [Phycisphaerae bacterium]|nr:MAG: hypothetical protein DHS20C16_24090 [Phycisphaerae bacterium]